MMATEKRLIDANALKERAIRVSTVKEHCYMKAVGTHEIDKAPTVDAVEVVRCKVCQNGADDAWPDGKVWCRKMCRYMNKEGFCSEGVKANDA